MKFFSKELWKRINSNDVFVRNKALKEWENLGDEYMSSFNLIKEKFPKKFLKAFDQNEGFHDYDLEKILFYSKRKKHCCDLHLSNKNDHFVLSLTDVVIFFVDFPAISLENCVGGKITWGYAELDYSSDRLFSVSVLFDCENEMMIRAKRITIRRKRCSLSHLLNARTVCGTGSSIHPPTS